MGRALAGGLLASLAATGAAAAAPLMFPAEQTMVPLAVAAAFALPALIAAVFALLRRTARALGPVIGIGVLAAAALAVAGYLNPGLLAALGI
jgi:hypothetical protein